MRIAIIAPEQIPVPPVLGGSVEITILAVARKLAERHHVTVVSRTHPRYPNHSVIDGVNIHRVPGGASVRYLENVRRFLSGKSYDVIQIDNRPRFVEPVKKMFPRTTVSLFLHSLTFVSPPYAVPAVAKKGLTAADLIVANSKSLKRQLARRFPSAADKIRTVWLGVDTARFTPSRRSGGTGPFTLLFAGRLIPRKGLPVLLRAARLVRDRGGAPVKVIVAGGAAKPLYGRQMRSLAARLGLNARFLGTVPHQRIHEIFRQADVFVCPSQKHEAFGLVNVEALASGVPVVASSIGGIQEVVRDGLTGFLIRSYRRPDAFGGAILRLMRDSSLHGRMRQAARQDCLRRFSWTATAQSLSRLYASHAARGGGS